MRIYERADREIPTMKSLGGNETSKKTSVKEGAAFSAASGMAAEKVDFSNVKIESLFEEMVDFETFSKSDFRAVKVLECEAVPKSKKLLKFVLDSKFVSFGGLM